MSSLGNLYSFPVGFMSIIFNLFGSGRVGVELKIPGTFNPTRNPKLPPLIMRQHNNFNSQTIMNNIVHD